MPQDKLMLDVGKTNELTLALSRAGFSTTDIEKLCQGTTLEHVKCILDGEAHFDLRRHDIDYQARPHVPRHSRLKSHSGIYNRTFDPAEIEYYLSDRTPESDAKLRYAQEQKLLLNANLLDFLLANTHLIPKELVAKVLSEEGGMHVVACFLGTVYRNPDGRTAIRRLYYWNGGLNWHWGWDWMELEEYLRDGKYQYPCAMLKKT